MLDKKKFNDKAQFLVWAKSLPDSRLINVYDIHDCVFASWAKECSGMNDYILCGAFDLIMFYRDLDGYKEVHIFPDWMVKGFADLVDQTTPENRYVNKKKILSAIKLDVFELSTQRGFVQKFFDYFK